MTECWLPLLSAWMCLAHMYLYKLKMPVKPALKCVLFQF
jgi:hypothetical protein